MRRGEAAEHTMPARSPGGEAAHPPALLHHQRLLPKHGRSDVAGHLPQRVGAAAALQRARVSQAGP